MMRFRNLRESRKKSVFLLKHVVNNLKSFIKNNEINRKRKKNSRGFPHSILDKEAHYRGSLCFRNWTRPSKKSFYKSKSFLKIWLFWQKLQELQIFFLENLYRTDILDLQDLRFVFNQLYCKHYLSVFLELV